jgi:hypothetical protein
MTRFEPANVRFGSTAPVQRPARCRQRAAVRAVFPDNRLAVVRLDRLKGILPDQTSDPTVLVLHVPVVSMRLDAFANTLAPALAELHSMGFAVKRQDDASYVAERRDLRLCGEDVLQLLALAILSERRGSAGVSSHRRRSAGSAQPGTG